MTQENNIDALDNDTGDSSTDDSKNRGRKKKEDMPAVSFDSLDKEVEDRRRRLAKVRATVDGTEYSFPVNNISLSDSARLGTFFTSDMLHDGQVFSINPVKGAFCVISECDIYLNADNTTWTYQQGMLTPAQLDALVYVVRAGNILIGDMGFAKVEPEKPKVFTVNATAILNQSPNEIFVSVSKIVQEKADGGDTEKVAKIKALMTYETRNASRPAILRLLQSALNNIPGYLGLDSTDEAIVKAEEQYDQRAKDGHYDPVKEGIVRPRGTSYVNAVL